MNNQIKVAGHHFAALELKRDDLKSLTELKPQRKMGGFYVARGRKTRTLIHSVLPHIEHLARELNSIDTALEQAGVNYVTRPYTRKQPLPNDRSRSSTDPPAPPAAPPVPPAAPPVTSTDSHKNEGRISVIATDVSAPTPHSRMWFDEVENPNRCALSVVVPRPATTAILIPHAVPALVSADQVLPTDHMWNQTGTQDTPPTFSKPSDSQTITLMNSAATIANVSDTWLLKVSREAKVMATQLRDRGVDVPWWNEYAEGDVRFAHGYLVGLSVGIKNCTIE